MSVFREFENEMGGITCVEECSRKEMLESIDNLLWLIDAGRLYNDESVFVEYDDGSYFYVDGYYGVVEGVFRRQHIRGIISNSDWGYAVYGNYRMVDGNMNVELV